MREAPHPTSPLKPFPRVSVVVPVFNAGSDLEQCLAAIAGQSYPNFECIVVDDASTDGRVEPATVRHGARLIRMPRRSGPASARNRGAAAATGEILFFTDADVLLHADALATAVEALQSDPQLSAVFGSYDDRPSHRAFLSQYRNLYHHWVHQKGNPEASTFWTGCGAIRRNVFLEVGGLRETYRVPSIEDIELGYRLRGRGHRLRLEKTMLCTHMKEWTFWNLLRTDVLRRGAPWVSLLLRSGRVPRDLNLGLRSRFGTAATCLFAVSLLALPMAGHFAATGPALAFVLTGAAGTHSAARERRTWLGARFVTALAVAVPCIAFALAPDPLAVIPLTLLIGVIGAEADFYRYLADKRGADFAISVVPMQLLFFLGCAAAVPLGFIDHLRTPRPLDTGRA